MFPLKIRNSIRLTILVGAWHLTVMHCHHIDRDSSAAARGIIKWFVGIPRNGSRSGDRDVATGPSLSWRPKLKWDKLDRRMRAALTFQSSLRSHHSLSVA